MMCETNTFLFLSGPHLDPHPPMDREGMDLVGETLFDETGMVPSDETFALYLMDLVTCLFVSTGTRDLSASDMRRAHGAAERASNAHPLAHDVLLASADTLARVLDTHSPRGSRFGRTYGGEWGYWPVTLPLDYTPRTDRLGV